jgi:hypothetical protein
MDHSGLMQLAHRQSDAVREITNLYTERRGVSGV